jgi:hypothetical protein
MSDFDPNKKEDCQRWLEDLAKVEVGDESLAWSVLERRRQLAIAHATRMTTPCTWTEDEDGNWWTGCGEGFVFTSDGPAANKMKWCCYCGHPIQEQPYKSEEEKETNP